jgi:uncharacterized protein YndB with AHSA1/START domain
MSGAGTADREIVLTRVFDCPRELVFKAWTDPELLMKWLCPKDFVVTFVELDLRPGGAWRSGMRSPDGIDYTMRGTYRQIVRPELLELTHSWEDDLEPGHEPGHEALMTVTFLESEERTTMVFHVTGLNTDEGRDGQAKGWSEAFNNMESILI